MTQPLPGTDEYSIPVADGSPASKAAIAQLQSQEQVDLLDAIDRLRRENIDADISIPQLVVCGDQSNGKSSLLEAIAQVPFPAGSGTTTLFTTEVILRLASQPSVTVSIEPHISRTIAAKEHLQRFQKHETRLSKQAFLAVHRDASEYLKAYEPDRGLWRDRLRVQISGPEQQHLTLVDLPGLIQSTAGSQTPDDVEAVANLAREYMANDRAIIIAVISASTDFQVQSIGNLIKNSTAKGRTLGVITKPDNSLGDDHAKAMIELARNQTVEVGLGWHVVKNLYHQLDDRSFKIRDDAENNFFSSGVWSSVPRDNWGIGSLRRKLSQSLLSCIQRDLPNLITEMGNRHAATKQVIGQLGEERTLPKDHRRYLTDVATKLSELTKSALDGGYDVNEVAEFFIQTRIKTLRNAINEKNDEFVTHMRENGRQYDIKAQHHTNIFGGELAAEPDFYPPYTNSETSPELRKPEAVSAEDYCKKLALMMQETRGKDLKGLISRNAIQAIFRQQSVKWEHITRAHVNACHQVALDFMRAATHHVAGHDTAQKLMRSFVNPAFDRKDEALEAKIEELLWPYQKCHPITENPSLGRGASSASETETSGDAGHEAGGVWEDHLRQSEEEQDGLRWGTYARKAKFPSNELTAADALDHAEDYYVIALNTLLDNVATLAIERCLLSDLPELILPNHITELSDEKVHALGAEPPEAREERAKAAAQAEALKAVMRICRRHAGQASSVPRRKEPVLAQTASQGTTIRQGLPSANAQGWADALPSRKTPVKTGRSRDASRAKQASTHVTSPFANSNDTPKAKNGFSSPFGAQQGNTPAQSGIPANGQQPSSSLTTFGTPAAVSQDRNPFGGSSSSSSSQPTKLFGGSTRDTASTTRAFGTSNDGGQNVFGGGLPTGFGTKPFCGFGSPP